MSTTSSLKHMVATTSALSSYPTSHMKKNSEYKHDVSIHYFKNVQRMRHINNIVHYRNPALCRVPEALPSAFYRALGKADFAECCPRQSPALGKEIVYRVPGTRHRQALGKDCCAEGQALGKHGSRQRAVSGRLPLTAVSLCRMSNI
jgi:hypothetical protein